jgi:uncharacterized membrane protein
VLDGKLDKVPFYRVLQSLRKRVTGQDDTEAWSVALVELEEALVPAFVVEELPDGRYTVFVPSAPSPVSGAVYLIDGSRVHIVDVPFATAFRSMSQWGLGASALLAAYQERKLVPHR